MTEAYGKMGGNIVGKNHFGIYVKKNSKPINRHSVTQQYQRGLYNQIVRVWVTLTTAQVSLWLSQVANYPRTNNIGNVYYPTPYNLFLELNLNLLLAGHSILTVPPAKALGAALPALGVVINQFSGTIIASFSPSLPHSTDVIIFAASPPVSQGTNVIHQQWRNIGGFPNSGQTYIDLAADYSSIFHWPLPPSMVFFKAWNISTAASPGPLATALASA